MCHLWSIWHKTKWKDLFPKWLSQPVLFRSCKPVDIDRFNFRRLGLGYSRKSHARFWSPPSGLCHFAVGLVKGERIYSNGNSEEGEFLWMEQMKGVREEEMERVKEFDGSGHRLRGDRQRNGEAMRNCEGFLCLESHWAKAQKEYLNILKGRLPNLLSLLYNRVKVY